MFLLQFNYLQSSENHKTFNLKKKKLFGTAAHGWTWLCIKFTMHINRLMQSLQFCILLFCDGNELAVSCLYCGVAIFLMWHCMLYKTDLFFSTTPTSHSTTQGITLHYKVVVHFTQNFNTNFQVSRCTVHAVRTVTWFILGVVSCCLNFFQMSPFQNEENANVRIQYNI